MIYKYREAGQTVICLRLSARRKTKTHSAISIRYLICENRKQIFFMMTLQEGIESEDARNVQRQAYAGLLWSKQFYYFNVHQWLKGDPAQPPPPSEQTIFRTKSRMETFE